MIKKKGRKIMEQYEEIRIEIIKLSSIDVITASGEDPTEPTTNDTPIN